MSSEGRLAPRCCAGHVTKLAVPFGPARQVTTACFYALGRHTHRRGDNALSSAEDTRTGGVTTPFLLRKTHAQAGVTTPFLLRKTHAQAGDNALSSAEDTRTGGGDNALSSAEDTRTGEGQRPFFCGRHMHRQEEDMHFLFGKTVDR